MTVPQHWQDLVEAATTVGASGPESTAPAPTSPTLTGQGHRGKSALRMRLIHPDEWDDRAGAQKPDHRSQSNLYAIRAPDMEPKAVYALDEGGS